jgi:ArsR family transcriptional regulator
LALRILTDWGSNGAPEIYIGRGRLDLYHTFQVAISETGTEPFFPAYAEARMNDPLKPARCAVLLKAVAEVERLRIIQCLRESPRNVGELAAQLNVEIVNVSHHLGVLRRAGIVQNERQGRSVLYRLHPQVFHPTPASRKTDFLDFGCCRLEMPKA